jgi:hypothetical protein
LRAEDATAENQDAIRHQQAVEHMLEYCYMGHYTVNTQHDGTHVAIAKSEFTQHYHAARIGGAYGIEDFQAYAFQQLADFLPRAMQNLENSGQNVMTFVEHIVRTRYGAPDAADMQKHTPEFRGFTEPILKAVGTLVHGLKVLEQNIAYRDLGRG